MKSLFYFRRMKRELFDDRLIVAMVWQFSFMPWFIIITSPDLDFFVLISLNCQLLTICFYKFSSFYQSLVPHHVKVVSSDEVLSTDLWFWSRLQRCWCRAVYNKIFCCQKLPTQCQIWHAVICLEPSSWMGKVRTLFISVYYFPHMKFILCTGFSNGSTVLSWFVSEPLSSFCI